MGERQSEKVFATNITSDEIITDHGALLHHIVCDHITESTGNIRRQVHMTCSREEYKSIMDNGYYEIENFDI